MLNSLKFLSGRSLALLLLLSVSMPILSSCTKLPIPMGGTNVAANTQLGQQNNQTLGTSTVTTTKAETIERVNNNNSKVTSDSVETVVVNEYPIWLIIAFVVAVLMDSPVRMFQDLVYGTRKK